MTFKSAGIRINRVRVTSAAQRRTRTSSSCGCEHTSGNRSCGDKVDPAVDAIQEAGDEISCIFGQLKNRWVANELAMAIRRRDGQQVQRILKRCGCDCKVVAFFCTHDSDCVRVCCQFGKWNEVKVTFDICINKIKNHC
ncbi:hypothetical protein [Paenibacillus sp. MMS18-CY102]|uniref:hypothetical protein n=1 Tax=Paenibacillus sp. MMS18-CY102 TaxID=2682849 RepID=UPI0013656E47|nr:hypothetical protein [Paenibacillus sp. MMS18-CY102]MWC27795.1 hypothetical protein [Paenibacillus sp. MMS18-CY102]